MQIEITIFGDGEESRTKAIETAGAGAGTINLVTLNPENGEGPTGMVAYYAFPVSDWPALRDQIDAMIAGAT